MEAPVVVATIITIVEVEIATTIMAVTEETIVEMCIIFEIRETPKVRRLWFTKNLRDNTNKRA